MVRKNFFIQTELAARARVVATDLDLDFSGLIRLALMQFIEQREKEKAAAELEEACKNYRDFNKKFSAEWSAFETKVR